MAISRDKVLKEAEKLVQKGKLDLAIKKYEKLLKANPNDVTTINRVGDLYGKVGEIDKAVELYERIADFFVQDGFVKKAIAVYKKINRMVPQRLDIFERLAELYLELSLTGEAKTQYQILVDWYIKGGDRENALRIQRKLADVDPGNHVVQLRLADMLMEAGEHEEGLQAFGQLIHVLLERDRLDEAEKLAQHILEFKPPEGGFVVPVCSRLIEAGRRDRAEELLHKAIELSPDDTELKALKIRLTMDEGGDAGAEMPLEMAESLLRSDPENMELRRLVGRKAIEVGDVEKARDVLGPALESALRRGDLRLAQELAEELQQALPNDLKVLLWSLRAFEPTGRQDRILEIKERLADLHYTEGRLDAAQALYMELADLDPENTTFRQRLLELSARGHVAGAKPAEPVAPRPATGAVPLGPPAAPAGVSPQERLGEARVFVKYGLVEKAVRHLEELLGSYPDFHDARRELVQVLCDDGQADRAREVAGPLEEHFRKESDEEGLAWLQGILETGETRAPELIEVGAAGTGQEAPATPVPEEAEEEEIIFLDLDAEEELVEVPEAFEEAAEAPAGEPAEVVEIPSEPEEPAVLEEESEAPAPGTGPEPIDLSWVDRAIQGELGETGGESAAPPAAAPVAGAEAPAPAVTEEEPEAAAPTIPEEVLEETGEHEELLDITGVVSGPPSSELERIDFFIAEELFEDAARMLADLESHYPDDPDLAERRLRLKEQGIILVEAEPAVEEEAAEELFSEEELYVDLASELEKELAEEEAMVEEATGHGKDEALLEEVFREFQRGVAEQLGEEDSDTHFNLGIAYKEMDLLAEAIGEFQIASKDPGFHLEACSMIAVCYMEQGLFDEAVRWYEEALASDGISPEARIALLYDLGSALLAAGREDEAYTALSEVAETDPDYRDVGAHLQTLQQQRHAN